MKRELVVSIVATAILFGCTSTRLINESSRTAYFEEINKTGHGRKGQIVKLDRQRFDGNNIHVELDSTSWTDTYTGLTKTVPTKDIREIVFIKIWRGAGQGFLIGAASGFGFVIGYLTIVGGDPCEGCNVYEFGVLVGGIWGAAGGVLGFLVGAVAESKDRYILSTSNVHLR